MFFNVCTREIFLVHNIILALKNMGTNMSYTSLPVDSAACSAQQSENVNWEWLGVDATIILLRYYIKIILL